MYHTPEMVGKFDQLKEVSQQEIDAGSSDCVQKCYPCDKDVHQLCCMFMFQHGPEEARRFAHDTHIAKPCLRFFL